MNEFSKITERKYRNYNIEQVEDDDGDVYTVKTIYSNRPGYKITIDQVGEDGLEVSIGMTPKTQQFMNCLEVMATKNNYAENGVRMTLPDYMKMTGETNKGRAIASIKSSILTLTRTKFHTREIKKQKGKPDIITEVSSYVIQASGISCEDDGTMKNRELKIEDMYKNGAVYVQFSDRIFDLLRRKQNGGDGITYMPDICLNANTQKYKCVREMGEYISEQKRINYGNGQDGSNHEDLLIVRSILKNCYQLPTREEVLATNNRNCHKRIIEPFFANMAALDDYMVFKYYHDDGFGGIGKPYTEEESLCATTLKYDDFLSTHVQVFWKNYPESEKLLSGRKTRTEKIKKAKDKASKQTEQIRMEV